MGKRRLEAANTVDGEASSHDDVAMLPIIEKLLILQDRDKKLRLLRVELKRAPLERQQLEARMAGTSKALEDARHKGKQIEVERKDLETQVKQKRDQIARYQTQKFQTRKNDEFQALSHEIERAEADIRKLEDRELDLMEAAEQQKASVAAAEKEAATAKSAVTSQLADLDTKVQTLEKQAADLEAERARLIEGVDEDTVDTYNHLIKNKGDNPVVGLEHGICGGCHMKVTPSTLSKVRAKLSVVNCENCSRMLYWVN